MRATLVCTATLLEKPDPMSWQAICFTLQSSAEGLRSTRDGNGPRKRQQACQCHLEAQDFTFHGTTPAHRNPRASSRDGASHKPTGSTPSVYQIFLAY